MQIQLLKPNHANKYKEIRLEALLNHPEAFSSSYEEEKNFSIEKYENRFLDEGSFTYGAFEEDQLIGIVTLLLEKKNKLMHRANIVAMYVDAEKRSRGIGKSLMLAAIDKAKEMGMTEQIYLSVIATNTPAKKLYHSLGFKTYGTDKNALKIDGKYFDDDLMVLVLGNVHGTK